jgi:hypothetical protein
MSCLRARRVLALGAVVVLAAGAQALPAAAASKTGYADPVVSKVMPIVKVSSDGTARVMAHYTCYGGPGGHLYIGVKQGPQINATTHTSSEFADTFYSTNYNSDGPGLTLTCDGKAHTQKFVVAPDPYFAFAHPNAPKLKTGPVFVQFCIFDATSNFAEEDPTGFGFDYSMKRAQTAS